MLGMVVKDFIHRIENGWEEKFKKKIIFGACTFFCSSFHCSRNDEAKRAKKKEKEIGTKRKRRRRSACGCPVIGFVKNVIAIH